MKRITTLISILFCLCSLGQTREKVKEELKNINSIEELDKLRKIHPDWQIDVIELNSNKEDISSKLDSLEKGETITIKEGSELFTYKLLESQKIKEFRVSHIYLNGRELSMKYIDSIRTVILDKYNKGVSFADLSKQYASYKKPFYDLGWFKENTMVPEFEDAVKEHKKGDVFRLDIPSKRWYYVVLKTFDDRETRILKLIKIKCNK